MMKADDIVKEQQIAKQDAVATKKQSGNITDGNNS